MLFNESVIKYVTGTYFVAISCRHAIQGFQYHTLIKYLEEENLKLCRYFISWLFSFLRFCGFKTLKDTKFRENGQKSQNSRNLIPAKFKTFKVEKFLKEKSIKVDVYRICVRIRTKAYQIDGITQLTLNIDPVFIYIESRDVGQRDIHVDSTSICQHWFIVKTQRWNNVDFGLTLKTILLSYHHALKTKIFMLTLKR